MQQHAVENLVLGDILEKRAETHRAETFLMFPEGSLTYGEVNDMANRMAQGFAARGVRQRDHVAVMLPNCAEFLYAIFALAKLGAVAVPVNTAYKGYILEHVLKTSDVVMLIVDEPLLERFAAMQERLPRIASVIVRTPRKIEAALPGLPDSAICLNRLFDHGAETPRIDVRHSDLQAIMYTSGTTGPSKGVMVSHAHALTCARDFLRYMDYRAEETIYCPLPLFHAAGLWDALMGALLAASRIAVVERFSASRFWNDIRRYKANLAMGVFSMIPILLKQPPNSGDKDHSLRAFYVGKSAQDKAFRERFGARSVENYASTEAGIALASPYGQWRTGSCGQVNHDIYEARVVDDKGREVGSGEPGELALRPKNPFVMSQGYYNFPDAVARSFRDQWFHTGDCVYRDEDGYFFFVDRIKDCIRRRGENISAFEVEEVVNSHPAVRESAVFAIPSKLEEDEVKVSVVLCEGAGLDPEDLAAYCRTHLPSFMAPRFIEFMEELPKTPTGKIAKHELRKRGDRGLTAQTWDSLGEWRGAASDGALEKAG